MNLFSYGTLMDGAIMAGVSGCRTVSRPVITSGYRRLSVRGQVYPALVEESGSQVEGLLYFDLQEAAWPRLDRFEGEMYRRISVEVVDGDGLSQSAETYLCKKEFRHLLIESDWSFKEFLKSGKRFFEGEYRGFKDIK